MDVLAAAREAGHGPDAVVLVARVPTSGSGPAPIRAFTATALEGLVSDRAERVAELGARPGQLHPVRVDTDGEGVLTLLALWRLGAVPVPLNPRLTEPEEGQARAALGGLEAPGAQVALWTSGTSGRPRGVALSYGAMRAHTEAVQARLELDPGSDRWLASLSLAHVGGLMLIFRALVTGTPLVALGSVSPREARALIHGEGRLQPPTGGGPVTHVSLVPTQLLRLLDATGDAPPPPSFRCMLVGGAHAPDGLLARARAAGWPVSLTYGMTEMSSQVATATPAQVAAKPGCVGTPLEGVEIRIGPDEEVLVRGPGMASAYLDGTNLADGDGWYHTGDLGRLDADGDLWITGRRSDRIVSGGFNVDATEVEDVLRGHPTVVDACVVGIPDDEWGEVVTAWVVPVEGEFDVDEIDAWLRQRLAGPKRPRRWVVESELPLNANGKPDRALVRNMLRGKT